MTIEEKAKAYDEAIERANSLLSGNQLGNAWIYKLLPELAESEDERIRKYLIERIISAYGKNSSTPEGIKVKDIIAWLEKQKEQETNDDEDILQRFSFYSYKDEPNILYLSGLYVNSEHRNKGIGTKILKIADEVAVSMKCNSILLKTEIDSDAERLYKNNGYSIFKKEGNQIWLKKQSSVTKLLEEYNKFAKGVLSNCAMSFINYLDAHKYIGKMCVSNEECEDIENAFRNAMWDRLHRYYCKYTEKLCEQKPANKIQLGKKYKCIASPRYTMFMIGKIYKPEDEFLCSLMNFCYDCFEQIEDDEQKTIDKVEPKFKVGDIVRNIDSGELFHIEKVDSRNYWNGRDSFYIINQEQWELVEQKSTNNKPKFNVGDWVMLDRPVLITKVEDMPYNFHEYWTSAGTWFGDATKAKLWTIQDAKDGDVLACKNGWTCIFKTLGNDETFSSYCFMDNTKWFCETGCECHTLEEEFVKAYNGTIYPATKEQRDTFFAKMREAGYEWDADKKELKKIEQKPVELDENRGKELSLSLQIQAYLNIASDELYVKGKPLYSEERLEDIHKCMLMWQKLHNAYFYQKPTWSEEDEEIHRKCICAMRASACGFPEEEKFVEQVDKWLKSLKDRVQPQLQLEWSEEDEERYLSCLKRLSTGNIEQPETVNTIWLKSLKDRVQPQSKQEWSEEDKERIEQICDDLKSGMINFYANEVVKGLHYKEIIESNIEWLKSLRPTWKPSLAQLNALSIVSKGNTPDDIEAIVSLYNDLKKLRKE